MKNKKKWLLFMILTLILIIFVSFNIFAKSAVKNIKVENINLSSTKDGIYYGSYVIDPVKVSIEVEIKSNQIIAISILEHVNGLGQKAETIINEVISSQSLQVDTISGATVSSTTILKAIENAIIQGGTQK